MHIAVLFLLFSVAYFVLPGLYVLQKLKISLKPAETFVISTLLGTLIFILLTLILRTFGLPYEILYLYGLVSLVLNVRDKSIVKKLKDYKTQISIPKIICLAILVLFSLVLVTAHLTSGYYPDGLHLAAARDGFWRIAIVQELMHSYPPQIPGFAGVPLKNYHFLYDLLVAGTSVLLRQDPIMVYEKAFSIFSSFMFVMGSFILLKRFVKNYSLATFATILSISIGNLSYILPYLSSKYTFFAKPNIFMSDQPFDQAHNPFNLFAFAIFLSCFVLLDHWTTQRKYSLFLVISFFIGMLTGIKIYAALVLFFGLAAIFVYEMIATKKLPFYFLTPLLFALPLFLIMKGRNFSILIWTPGWLLDRMISDGDRLNWQDMVARREHYKYTENIWRLYYLHIQQTLTYLFGNLNIRILSLLSILTVYRPSFSKRLWVFFLSTTAFALVLPFFVNQKRASYDSIQFTQYALLTLGILAGIIITRLARSVRNRYGILAAGLFLSVLVLVAVPTNAYLYVKGFERPNFIVPIAEVEALTLLQQLSQPEEVVLNNLNDVGVVDSAKLVYMYIPAISARRNFYTAPTLAEQLGVSTFERREEIARIFTQSGETLHESLRANNISYIYLSAVGYRTYSESFLQLLYDNGNAVIYKVL